MDPTQFFVFFYLELNLLLQLLFLLQNQRVRNTQYSLLYNPFFWGSSVRGFFLHMTLGVPAKSRILMADPQKLSFLTLIMKPILVFLIRHSISTHNLCPACLLNKIEQASQAELVCRQGLSDQKIKSGFIIRVEKLSFCGSAIKIRDVAGTPRNGSF